MQALAGLGIPCLPVNETPQLTDSDGEYQVESARARYCVSLPSRVTDIIACSRAKARPDSQYRMYLYKASGATYRTVVRKELHAFPYSPAEVSEDECILLSKNREDCAMLEKQVQYAAKLHSVRAATEEELDAFFPDVAASGRWRFALKLYWVRPFRRPFNLTEVTGLNAKRYSTVQGFAKLDPTDELAMLRHLIATNADLILDVLNNAQRPETDSPDDAAS